MLSRTLRFLAAAALAASLLPAAIAADGLTAPQRGADFDALWRALEKGYAYPMPRRVAGSAARERDRARALAARDRDAFVAALETSLQRLRDEHVTLSEHSAASPRAVPLETDVWPAWRAGVAVVEAVRAYGEADVAGLRPGDRIRRIDGATVEQAVRQWLPPGESSAEARGWALRHALAGPRSGALRLEVGDGAATRTLRIERGAVAGSSGPAATARRIGEARDLGYLRIRGALDDPRVHSQLPPALQSLQGTRALVVDLREAHGDGGRAEVEAFLARFATGTVAWRIREDARGRRATDTVSGAGGAYRGPVVVLVDRWTAGDGEALAAGLRAVAGARIVGTPMAGMRGELREVTLPHSGIRVRFPAERVLHVDGTPREQLRPEVAVDLAAPDGGPGDPILYQALKILER